MYLSEYNDEQVDGTDDEKLLSIRQIESFVKVMEEDKQYKPTMRAEKLRRVKLAIKCFNRVNLPVDTLGVTVHGSLPTISLLGCSLQSC